MKTRNLCRLQTWGFQVPPFVIIPSDSVQALWNEDRELFLANLAEVVLQVVRLFPYTTYAIRSSALIEDGNLASFAGQFQTEVAVTQKGIKESLFRIITHAREYLQAELHQFSVIIQEFIAADISGVTFTKDPVGGRDMLVEYVQGKGENLVSGKVTPERLQFDVESIPSSTLPNFPSQVRTFQKIEALAGGPQDIEWCIKDNQWYFLQTRPITTHPSEAKS